MITISTENRTAESTICRIKADGVDTQSMIQTKWYDRTEEDEADRWKEMTGRPSENYVFANGVWYFDKTHNSMTQVTLERKRD